MEIVDGAVGYLRSEGVAADGVHYLANCFTIADRIAEAAQRLGRRRDRPRVEAPPLVLPVRRRRPARAGDRAFPDCRC